RERMLVELKNLGYSENNNLFISYYNIGNYEGAGINTLKMYLPENDYKAVIVNGTVAASAAKNVMFNNMKYSGVFVNVTDPVGVGLIKKLNVKPDYNFTGIAYPVSVEERLTFLRKLFPKAKKIGYIYADMPQSISYNQWLADALAKPEFKDIELISRKVDFIKSEGGYKRMIQIATPFVTELDSIVDVFLSPNDQLGSQEDFAMMIYQNASKPLIGLAGEKGCTASYGPNLEENGVLLAHMVKRLIEGTLVKDIIPTNSKPKVYVDDEKMKKFGAKLPDEYKKLLIR
ncbi:MAG TPA: ABC transporter substrate binding protein, partial [Spirochaetota bacterium]|nr:ABC transporter substrate binding protein [Spirochaetota bacterium]